MAKARQRNEKQSEREKAIIPRRVAIFLACAILVCAAIYLVHKSQFGINAFDTNRQSGSKTDAINKARWAQRLELPGLPNFHKVSDDLYRGAQPAAEGMRQLEKLGIKTVVNLRSFHSDRNEIEGTVLAYEHIYMKTWHPELEEVVRFLKIVSDKKRVPVFVHCMHGADRTGTMCAIYRIAMEGWSKDEAIEEMTKGGFGFHSVWKNLADYIRVLDIDEIKRSAGLNE